jgi:hypothetical protein
MSRTMPEWTISFWPLWARCHFGVDAGRVVPVGSVGAASTVARQATTQRAVCGFRRATQLVRPIVRSILRSRQRIASRLLLPLLLVSLPGFGCSDSAPQVLTPAGAPGLSLASVVVSVMGPDGSPVAEAPISVAVLGLGDPSVVLSRRSGATDSAGEFRFTETSTGGGNWYNPVEVSVAAPGGSDLAGSVVRDSIRFYTDTLPAPISPISISLNRRP